MATLEERIQNLTQDIRPTETEMVMDMVNKTIGPISNREMEIFRSAMPTNSLAPSVSTLDQKRLEQAFKEIQSLAGVLTNKEQDMLSQANDPITLLTTLRDIKQNLRSSGRLMSDTDKEIAMNAMPSNPMQPLVDLGFGDQVNVILSNPSDSEISRQAQQQIINEMGRGMDIDSFLMEVNNLAPKGAMSDADAGIMGLMSAGRNEDTTVGHLAEGDVVVPPEVLEANPIIINELEDTMLNMGVDPRSRIVDTTGELGGIASINPETGLQEFFIKKALSKLNRARKKVTKKLAPIVSVAAPFIPGVGPLAKAAITAASGKAAGLSTKDALLGGALSYGGSKLFGGTPGTATSKGGSLFTGGGADGIGRFGKVGDFFGKVKSGISGLFGGGQQPLPEEIQYDPVNQGYINTKTGMPVSDEEIKRLQGGSFIGGAKTPSFIKGIEDTLKGQTDPSSSSLFAKDDQGGLGMMGKLGIAGLAGLIGKLAYEEAKDQKGVPLTPLTQMDPLGRYNIEAEIARRTGAEMPSRVEFGLTPEGMPALSGGKPRNARYGGIMAFADGGVVAMAEGGDMDVAINVEEFPVRDGQINGAGTETSDDIPAMLSDGEFVMTAKAVRGAGSFDVNNNNGILTLTPNGEPTRESGTKVMYKLMEHFGNMA